MVNDHANL